MPPEMIGDVVCKRLESFLEVVGVLVVDVLLFGVVTKLLDVFVVVVILSVVVVSM